MMWKPGDFTRAWRLLRDRGIGSTLQHAQRRLRDRLFLERADRRLDAQLPLATGVQHGLEELTVNSANLRHGQAYEATPAAFLPIMLRSLPGALHNSVFVDFGSGKGRVLLLAADGPFDRLVGVEFAEELHTAANANVAHAGLQHRVSLVLGDAAEFAVPDEPCVLYFYNPFEPPVLQAVLANIRRSYERSPRPLYVIYYNPRHTDVFEEAGFLAARPLPLLQRLHHRVLGIADVRTFATREVG